jgi:hypothetical protein
VHIAFKNLKSSIEITKKANVLLEKAVCHKNFKNSGSHLDLWIVLKLTNGYQRGQFSKISKKVIALRILVIHTRALLGAPMGHNV